MGNLTIRDILIYFTADSKSNSTVPGVTHMNVPHSLSLQKMSLNIVVTHLVMVQ